MILAKQWYKQCCKGNLCDSGKRTNAGYNTGCHQDGYRHHEARKSDVHTSNQGTPVWINDIQPGSPGASRSAANRKNIIRRVHRGLVIHSLELFLCLSFSPPFKLDRYYNKKKKIIYLSIYLSLSS